jgi:alkaline phosphatase D
MIRIVFASCMDPGNGGRQKVWKDAAAHNPDWLVLGGDNIYMDWGLTLNRPKSWSLQKFKDEMFDRYSQQFAVATFQSLLRKIPQGQVVGVWDDHDFAWNNCYGADPAHGMSDKKKIATCLYHHYFEALNIRPLPPTLPAIQIPDLNNPPNGTRDIYRVVQIGTAKALLCDGRTYRERNPLGTQPASLLGSAQEQWLFNELNTSAGPFIIISGSTMTASEDQSWDYYSEFFRNRFLPAVRGKTVIFLGGDVHENRLPPRAPDWPIEAVSSAAALGWPFLERKFGVMDLDESEARFFLYKNAKVEYTGKLNWASGKFKTNMVVEVEKTPPTITAKQAASQRSSAMKKLASMR